MEKITLEIELNEDEIMDLAFDWKEKNKFKDVRLHFDIEVYLESIIRDYINKIINIG